MASKEETTSPIEFASYKEMLTWINKELESIGYDLINEADFGLYLLSKIQSARQIGNTLAYNVDVREIMDWIDGGKYFIAKLK